MKRILALVLTIVMLLSIVSCNTNKGESDTTPQETTNESTTPEETTPADTSVTYTVTVVDENDAPLEGATVQLCIGNICRLPSTTNADGIATFKFGKGAYIAKVTLDGYTGEAEYTFAENSTELKVQLTKISEVTTPEVTTPEVTTPEVTTPEVTTPEETIPAGTPVTYTVIVVDENDAPLEGATVQLCMGDICRLPSITNADGVATFKFEKGAYIAKVTLAGYTGEVEYKFAENSTELRVQLTKTPEVTTPEEDDPTIPEIEVSLPEASKVIANIIGAVAASVEVSENSQFVFVLEQEDKDLGFNGSKQVLFIEVAEAAVDSDGEVLKAHLKAKVGKAIVELPAYGASKNIVVEKDDITSYYEFEISVNGDDVSIVANDQNASLNLSELVYGKIAQMLGVDDIETLEAMLKSAYIAQELEKNLMPIIAAAIGGTLEELPTVSPAYIEHLETLFVALGEDIVTKTTDDVTSNTTISLNIAALKNLLSEIEGKTLAQYLEGVYGENVVASLSSFLKSIPDKKVKDIVDAAVTLAESTDVSVQEIYALIDMYILTVTGEEFSIEEQINERYNNTLAELLAEYNGVKPEEQDKFIESMKASFANVADMLETVSIDALLSSMFMDTNEGFIENLKATIDMFDEQIVYNLTVDADGYVLALNYGIGDLQYNMVVEGEATILTVSMPNGVEFVVTINGEGFTVAVKQDGEQVATGSMTVTEEINGEDVVTTVVVDIQNSEADLVDFTLVNVNGVVTQFDVVIRGYNVERNTHYYPEPVEFIEVTEKKELVDILAVEYKNDGTIAFNATVKVHDAFGEGHGNPETGEYFETWVREWSEMATIAYSDLGDGTAALTLLFGGVYGVQINQESNELTVDITVDGESVASGSFGVTSEVVDDKLYETIKAELRDAENELLSFSMVYVDGILTTLDAVVNGYYTESEWVEAPKNEGEQDDYFDGSLDFEKVENNYVIATPNPDGSIDFDGDYIVTIKPVEPNGEWVYTPTFVNWLTVAYDNANDASVLHIIAHEEVIPMADDIVITVENNQASAVLSKNGELVANVTLSVTETGLSVEVNNATETVFQAGVEFIDNAEGEDFIRVEYQGIEVIYGYKVDENGVKFAVYNNGDEVVALFEAVKNDSSVVLTSVLGPKGDELLSAVVTFTVAEDELVIDIDLDHLLIYQMISEILFEKCYIEFDGAITIKVA